MGRGIEVRDLWCEPRLHDQRRARMEGGSREVATEWKIPRTQISNQLLLTDMIFSDVQKHFFFLEELDC